MQDMKAYLDEQTDFGEYFALDRQFHIELIDSLQDPYFSSLKSSGMGFLNHPELQLNEKVPLKMSMPAMKKFWMQSVKVIIRLLLMP